MDLENNFFSNMPITLELTFFLKIEREKILDTCLGAIQTLDQGPGGDLEIVFFNMAITLERRDLFYKIEHEKILEMRQRPNEAKIISFLKYA